MIICVATAIGNTVALSVASFSVSCGLNWRYAFWFGAGIALVGSIARMRLRETPEFADAKRRLLKIFEDVKKDPNVLKDNPIVQEKVNNSTSLALFAMQCSGPICLYFVYFYCSDILKANFHYSNEQVIHNNLIVSLVSLIGYSSIAYISYYIYPLKFLRYKLLIFLLLTTLAPYILSNASSVVEILYLQIAIMFFGMDTAPALPIFYSHLPVFKRYTYSSLTHAMSRVIMYVTTSFGAIYLSKYLGNYGILLITIPICIAFAWGLNHFANLEKKAKVYV